jgi:hypothetical protein
MPDHVHLIAASAEWAVADLWRSAPPLHQAINARFHWTGYLFHGRYDAVAMDEPHLLARRATSRSIQWSRGW